MEHSIGASSIHFHGSIPLSAYLTDILWGRPLSNSECVLNNSFKISRGKWLKLKVKNSFLSFVTEKCSNRLNHCVLFSYGYCNPLKVYNISWTMILTVWPDKCLFELKDQMTHGLHWNINLYFHVIHNEIRPPWMNNNFLLQLLDVILYKYYFV